MGAIARTSLYYSEGSSDKEYHAEIVEVAGGNIVNFRYGRRGASLTVGTKTAEPVDFAQAKKIFAKLVKDKTSKGYTPDVSGAAYQGTANAGLKTDFTPQLLNPITEDEAMRLIADERWAAQEKMDGERRAAHADANSVTGMNRSRIVASLAKNPSISDVLMKKFAASDIDEVRAGLACNTSLPESIQARLIAGGSNSVRENLARNAALKVAQQAQLAYGGDVDVRLALLDNPSLDEQIRTRVASSFTNHDLISAESNLESAEKESTNLFNEHQQALQKCIKSYGGIFPSSKEKIERLDRAADRIQTRINEVDRKIIDIEKKCRKIKVLLEQHPTSSMNGGHDSPRSSGGIFPDLTNAFPA